MEFAESYACECLQMWTLDAYDGEEAPEFEEVEEESDNG